MDLGCVDASNAKRADFAPGACRLRRRSVDAPVSGGRISTPAGYATRPFPP